MSHLDRFDKFQIIFDIDVLDRPVSCETNYMACDINTLRDRVETIEEHGNVIAVRCKKREVDRTTRFEIEDLREPAL